MSFASVSWVGGVRTKFLGGGVNVINVPSFDPMRAIYKQTKNRNETGSNLSLGTRFTVLSKRRTQALL